MDGEAQTKPRIFHPRWIVRALTVNFIHFQAFAYSKNQGPDQGPVVQSVVSLTSSFRVISLTILADSIINILIFFAEKM